MIRFNAFDDMFCKVPSVKFMTTSGDLATKKVVEESTGQKLPVLSGLGFCGPILGPSLPSEHRPLDDLKTAILLRSRKCPCVSWVTPGTVPSSACWVLNFGSSWRRYP